MKKFLIEKIITDKSTKDIPVGVCYNFSDGINLICGNNETGKSSMFEFIKQGLLKKNETEIGRIYFKITDDNFEQRFRADISKKDCKLFSDTGEKISYDFIQENLNKKYFEEGFNINLDDIFNIKKQNNTLINIIKDPSNEKLSILLNKIRNELNDILGKNKRPIQKTAEYLKLLKIEMAKIKELSSIEKNYNNAVEEIKKVNEELENINTNEKFLKLDLEFKYLAENLEKETKQKNLILIDYNEKLNNNQNLYAQILQNSGKIEINNNILNKNSEKTYDLNKKITNNIELIKNKFLIDITIQNIENFNTDYNIQREIKRLITEKNELENKILNLEHNKENVEDTILRLNQSPLNNTKQEKFFSFISLLIIISVLIISVFCFFNKFTSTGIFSILIFIFLIQNKIQIYRNEKEKTLNKEMELSYNREKIENINIETENLKNEILNITKNIKEIIKNADINIKIPYESYIDVLEIIKNTKNYIKEKNDLKKTTQEIENANEKLLIEYDNFIKTMGIKIPYNNNFEENIKYIKNYNEKNLEINNKLEVINEKISKLKVQLKETKEKKEQYSTNIKYTDEESLKIYKQELLHKRKEAEFKKREFEHFEGINTLQMKKQDLTEKFRQKIYTLIKNKMILDIIQISKDSFDKIQPDIINAQKYLKIITDGKYSKIDIDMEEIQNEDGGKIKKWNDLSRGTKEQVYFALRLGYASNYTIDRITHKGNGKPNLPLLIDDAFVNFDEICTKQAIKCLVEFSKTNQILFFTCHKENMKSLIAKYCNEIQINPNIIDIL